jgi:hypothetical protein
LTPTTGDPVADTWRDRLDALVSSGEVTRERELEIYNAIRPHLEDAAHALWDFNPHVITAINVFSKCAGAFLSMVVAGLVDVGVSKEERDQLIGTLVEGVNALEAETRRAGSGRLH